MSDDELDWDGETALHRAVSTGLFELIEHTVKQGADVSAKNADGKTALDIAQEMSFKETVKLLKSYGVK